MPRYIKVGVDVFHQIAMHAHADEVVYHIITGCARRAPPASRGSRGSSGSRETGSRPGSRGRTPHPACRGVVAVESSINLAPRTLEVVRRCGEGCQVEVEWKVKNESMQGAQT